MKSLEEVYKYIDENVPAGTDPRSVDLVKKSAVVGFNYDNLRLSLCDYLNGAEGILVSRNVEQELQTLIDVIGLQLNSADQLFELLSLQIQRAFEKYLDIEKAK